MTVHELKCWPELLEPIIEGRKTFEVRKNDRDYKVGDRLWLRGWDPNAEAYTDREHTLVVTYVLRGGSFGIADDHVVMGLRPFRFEDYPDPTLRQGDLT